MAKRMLIDATQAEETRVAVLDGNRLEELDFEIASRKQLKGNIYLAKVTRVEPSLQAAFVEYGGNRHGFLAFAEIHPDYYKIPVADKEKLLELERELEREEAELEAAEEAAALAKAKRLPIAEAEDAGSSATDAASNAAPDILPPLSETTLPLTVAPVEAMEGECAASPITDPLESIEPMERDGNGEVPPAPPRAEESDEDADRRRFARRRAALLRQYKIQEVIKRNQILLIQVVKEERGNKGAALTTYLSLAGRYCVLMPNTNRGGGVSRKISSMEERRRMKQLLAELALPEGMSIILRTAGLERSKSDIKRDLEYVMRLWDSIRDKTLSSTAPSLIHEEASLIRRSIRDLYARDVTEIQVEGDAGYHMAKEFMRMIMPSAARRVHHYRDPAVPLFVRHRVESQIEALYKTTVTLKSGGYIVINQTEALVAIDVNSGRSTRERNIEETALRTNIEAAEEVARQVRLRDLAGLIVIDFIDMEDQRHNAQVERKMRDAMKGDRARIQLGRISMFGLMELSRQRLRPSLIETNFSVCQGCGGMGHTRSVESAALHVLRSIEEEGLQQKASELAVNVAEDVALYLLNHKRAALGDIERRYGIKVFIHSDSELRSSEHKIERLKARQPGEFQFPEPPPPVIEDEPEVPEEEDAEEESFLLGDSSDSGEDGSEGGEGRRRNGNGGGGRNGRNRGGRNRGRGRDRAYPDVSQPGAPQPELPPTQRVLGDEELVLKPAAPVAIAATTETNGAEVAPGVEGETAATAETRRRRRGRRGGRGRNRGDRTPRDPSLEGAPQPDLPPDFVPTTDTATQGFVVKERAPRPAHRPEHAENPDRPQRDRRPFREREPREHREPRVQSQQPVPAAQPSNGGIKILTEIKGRNDVAPPAPQPQQVSAHTPAPTGGDDKPKSGWWKRLMGTN